MSIDIDVRMPGAPADWRTSFNITYNLAPAYYRVMRAAGVRQGFRGLDGMTMGEARPKLEQALAFFDRHEERLERLWEGSDSYNGWGKTSCIRRVLVGLLQPHPDAAIIEVC